MESAFLIRSFEIDSEGKIYFMKDDNVHRDTDVVACIAPDYISYIKSNVLHRVGFPALIWSYPDALPSYYEYGWSV